jgi:HD domain
VNGGERSRLAEVLAALSLATDLGAAWPPETAMKTCLVAVGLARRVGLGEPEVADAYYLALLRSVACTSFAHEMAEAWGDDIGLRRLMDPLDTAEPEALAAVIRALGQGKDTARGARAAAHLASPAGQALADQLCLAHRDVGRRFASRLGLGGTVGDGLGQVYERWDGRGMPGPLAGEQIPPVVRVVHVAYVAELAFRDGGPGLAAEVVRRRSGGHVDPAVAAALLEDPGDVLGPIAPASVWDPLLEAEPEPRRWIDARQLDTVLEAFADFVDLKSPYTLGHSPGVARLAADAGEVAGLDAGWVERLRRAGLVHDLGRVSVSNAIWDERGRLTHAEWERVRLHPHYSERVLGSTPLLAPLGRLVGLHHERLDGSGHTGPRCPRPRPPVSCAPPWPRAVSTATPPRRCWRPRVSGPPACAGPGRAGSPKMGKVSHGTGRRPAVASASKPSLQGGTRCRRRRSQPRAPGPGRSPWTGPASPSANGKGTSRSSSSTPGSWPTAWPRCSPSPPSAPTGWSPTTAAATGAATAPPGR